MPTNTNASEISRLLTRLLNLRHDPELFAQTKRLLLEQYIASLPEELQQQTRDFQEEIDNMVVVSGTPFRAISMLMAEMAERCKAMDGFNKQLKNPDSP